MKGEHPNEIVEVTLPKLGESIVGATVVQWLKKEGEHVALDEALLEVSTDKVNSEIPSPVAGLLREICVSESQEIEVGALLAKIETGEVAAPVKHTQGSSGGGKEHYLSPAVLSAAHVEGVSLEQLRKIEGSGEGGGSQKKMSKILSTPVKPPVP